VRSRFELDQFDRQRAAAQPGDELGLVHNHDEAPGVNFDDFLTETGASQSLDQVEFRVYFVGAIHRYI
jgi:hypothetical protein